MTESEYTPLREEPHGTLFSYVTGFISSVVLTLIAYFLIANDVLTGMNGVVTVILLAFIQAYVQLVCFMNLGEGSRPRWNLITFLFMGMVVTIVVLGTMWIIYDLDHRVMHP